MVSSASCNRVASRLPAAIPRGDGRILKDIAATPHRLDVMTSAGRLGKFFPELANKDVDDLELGLVHPAVEVVEDHLLRQGLTLAEAEQFQDAIPVRCTRWSSTETTRSSRFTTSL